MKYEGIVKVSIHKEYPQGMRIVGDRVEESTITEQGLSWLRVTSNGVSRDILVTSLRPLYE